MKKIILFNLILALPLIAGAAGLQGPIISCVGDPCTLTDLINIIYQVINYCFIIVVPLAILAFLYAGILFVTSPADSGNVSKAKGIIWDAVIGVVFVLAAYLVVKAIIAGLGGDPTKYGIN